jgi:NADPH:quinone reductase-like Zn-dependent oxidoreductase
VQLAKMAGAEVTGVCSPAKADLVRSIGADHVIDYTREDYTRGGRYDRILDAIANRWVFKVRRALTPNGVYRAHGARTTAGLLQAMVVGPLMSVGRGRSMGVVIGRPNDATDLATVGELVQAGTLVPVIDRRYTLDQVPEALRYYGAGQARGKLIITM